MTPIIELVFERYCLNRPPFKMEYRHLSEIKGIKKLLHNWDISVFQLRRDLPYIE